MNKRIIAIAAGIVISIAVIVIGIVNIVSGSQPGGVPTGDSGSSYNPGTSSATAPGTVHTQSSVPIPVPTPTQNPAEASDTMGSPVAGTDFAIALIAEYVRYQTSESATSREARLAPYFSDRSQIPVGDFTPSVYESNKTTTNVKYGGVKSVSVAPHPNDKTKWDVTIMATYSMELTTAGGSVSYRIGQAPYTVTMPANFVAGQLALGFTDPRIP